MFGVESKSCQEKSISQNFYKYFLHFTRFFFRTIAETPSNECSSRSHCIFTIYITTKTHKTGKIRRSKLNLVDLAGYTLISLFIIFSKHKILVQNVYTKPR